MCCFAVFTIQGLGLKFGSTFCNLPSCALLRVTFCVIITVSQSKASTIFCYLELHVRRKENRGLILG